MADELQPKLGSQEDQNADVARKVADQDIAGKTMAPEETKAAGDALDSLLQEAEKKAEEAGAVEGKDKPKDTPVEGAPKVDVTPPVTPVVEDPNKKRAEEIFKDSPALPANASP